MKDYKTHILIDEEGIAELVYMDWDVEETIRNLRKLFPDAKNITYMMALDPGSIMVKVDGKVHTVNEDGTLFDFEKENIDDDV